MFPDLTISPIIPSLAKQLGLAFPGITMDPQKASEDGEKSKLEASLNSTLNSTLNSSLSLIPLNDGVQTPLKLVKDREIVGTPEKYYSVDDFIEMVKSTPYLYDKYHRLYRDSHIKDVRWAEIGNRYGMTGPQMVKKWTHIRDRYKRILNELTVRNSRGERFTPTWKFFDVLHGMLSRNYSASHIQLHSAPKSRAPSPPGSASPITTINFANAAQLYTAALHQAAMNQSLNSSADVGCEPGSDKDEIIAADYMVAETHFDDDHERGDDQDEVESLASSVADVQSHHSTNSHKENTAPVATSLKRSPPEDLTAEAPAQLAKKRKNSGSTSDPDSGCEVAKVEKDFIEHFVRYIGERIRSHEKSHQLYVVNKIHQALFDFEMELAKP